MTTPPLVPGAARIRPRSGAVRYEVPILRALLVTVSSVLALVWLRYHGLPLPLAAGMRWMDAGWIIAGALVLWGGASVAERSREARTIATAGIVLASLLLAWDLWDRPEAAYVPLVAAAGLVARIWPRTWAEPPTGLDPGIAAAYEARTSAMVALGAWAVAVPAEWTARRSGAGALALVAAVSTLFALRWAWLDRRAGHHHWVWAILGIATAWSTAALQWRTSPLLATAPLLIGPIATWLAAAPARQRTGPADGFAAAVIESPARFMWASFAILSLWGAAVLGLPVCAGHHARIPFLDALFTAVSASCVSGLAVRDPGDFSALGHLAILLLVQAGGLGIMCFSAASMAIVGRRMNRWTEQFRADPRAAAIAREHPGVDGREDLRLVLRRVILVTLAVEASGAAVLAYLFRMNGDPLPTALWTGTFTAICAFCNAGFGLTGANLGAWRDQPLVTDTVAFLVILGGLGPTVIAALPVWIGRRRASVATRLIVWTSLFLLVTSTLMLALFESQHSMAHLRFWPWLHNAFLLSASARSAGFTTVDLTQLHPASVALLLGLMFVGGAPGSTAGGVKVTTFGLLALAVLASIRGDSVPTAFGRRFPAATIYRAFTVTTFGMLAIFPALTALLVTQDLPFETALFEVTSALGNSGLTLGATPQLDEIGKVVIVACMFAGRVGPLTIFLLLTGGRRDRPVGLPEQDVPVG